MTTLRPFSHEPRTIFFILLHPQGYHKKSNVFIAYQPYAAHAYTTPYNT